MSIAFLVGLAVAAVGGVLIGGFVHEVCHYAVLRAFDRSPEFKPPRYADGRITASVNFQTPPGEPLPWDIRLAAMAPMLVGLLVAVPLMITVALVNSAIGYIAFVTTITWVVKPSQSDIRLARGRQAPRYRSN